MTKAYEDLQEGPITGLDTSLAPDERAELRRIQVSGFSGHGWEGNPGRLTTVYYLAGDESKAARKFVEENRDQLEKMDFSKKSPLSGSVSREMFDLILHHLGERRRTVYSTLVVEKRPDGTQWLIDKQLYQDQPGRRYTIGETGVVRVPPDVDLKKLYEQSDQLITEETIKSWPVKGDVRQILDYFRQSSAFTCAPTTIGDELAVKKVQD